jgi:hypothetical protein
MPADDGMAIALLLAGTNCAGGKEGGGPMRDFLMIYGLWTLHGLVTLLRIHWPVLEATLQTSEQEWILYLQ